MAQGSGFQENLNGRCAFAIAADSRNEVMPGRMIMGKKIASEMTFELSLKELERIVEQLEAGDLPLERSLELFEQGVQLSRECQKRLDEAERKVEILLKGSDGAYTSTAFDEPEE
jgi:exodeoxyribonuclease VII small subunit